MIEKIKKQIEKNPNKIFYKNGDNCITYLELWNQSLFYAELLKKQGNSPVVIYGDKEIYVIISIIACLMSNRAYVPIASYTPIDRLKRVLRLTKTSLIISKKDLHLDDFFCCSLENLRVFENEDIKDTLENEIAYIIFTSGSTGEPKGVPISYVNLNNFVDWISNLFILKDFKNINVLNQADFSFDLSVADFYYSLCNGHTLNVLNNLNNFDEIFSVLKKGLIDLSVMTPTFMKFCLLNNDFNNLNYPNFKCVYFCGEQLEVKLVKRIFERFPDIKIINAYGPTEATSAVSAIEITKQMLNIDLLPVGDMNNLATEIEIIDNEIILSGESVFSGYIGLDSENVYNEDGQFYYKTGDVGFIENDILFCKGRVDDQIKYNGYRIELNDIKHNLDMIDGIKDSVVIPKYNGSRVKGLKAFVVCRGNFDKNNIRNELSKRLPYYMIPNSIVEIDKIPTNNNGKVDKEKLNRI